MHIVDLYFTLYNKRNMRFRTYAFKNFTAEVSRTEAKHNGKMVQWHNL